ncbi:MAG: DUF2254 domain-containing protein [Rhodomicrobium sp.]|nr:DUF2254 domain-containing protein [Rhodomicrobium sp.]
MILSRIRPLLLNLFYSLKASFWLIPILMLAGALLTAPAIVRLDVWLAANTASPLWQGFKLSPDGAREILSVIAGSMITVASLVFSMTLVALSLVSQQLGPRIPQIFMEDRPTQVMLGLFIATFLFALAVLGSLGIASGGDRDFVPRISVLIAAILAVFSFVAIILFIHHIARSIQADIVVFNTAQKLQSAIGSMAHDCGETAMWLNREEFEALSAAVERNACDVKLSRRSGYVQYVDEEGALALAKEHDVRIALRCRPGHFVLRGRPLLLASPADRIEDELREKLESLIHLGELRTREQRVEFEMLALVEIALRAISPGINDPFTAISCIDRLSEALANLMERDNGYRVLTDKDGDQRVLCYPQTFEHYLDSTFDPIRHAAADIPMVLDRIEHTLKELQAIAAKEMQARALGDQLGLLEKQKNRPRLNNPIPTETVITD